MTLHLQFLMRCVSTMDSSTVAEKMDVLMQTLACVGSYPTSMRCIAHDCGFTIVETVSLMSAAIRQHPEIKISEQGYYIDEN